MRFHDEDFDPRWNGWRSKQPSWHFSRALFQRYGIVLEHGEFSEIMRAIRSGHAELIERHEKKSSIYAIYLSRHGKTVFIASRKGLIMTDLPPTPYLRRKWRRLTGHDDRCALQQRLGQLDETREAFEDRQGLAGMIGLSSRTRVMLRAEDYSKPTIAA